MEEIFAYYAYGTGLIYRIYKEPPPQKKKSKQEKEQPNPKKK